MASQKIVMAYVMQEVCLSVCPKVIWGGKKVSFNCKKRTLCNDIDSMIRSCCLFLRVF